MSANVPGQVSLTINGQKWSVANEPTCTPSQVNSTKIQDSAGRVVGNKEMQNVPGISNCEVILVGDKGLQSLLGAITEDTTVEVDFASTDQTFSLTGARSAQVVSQTGHTATIEMQGDTGTFS